MRVVKYLDGGIVRRVVLFDDAGVEVVLVTRFLAHLADFGFSPNTLCAYGYDLRRLAEFLDRRAMSWSEFTPAVALEFLGYLRRLPSRRPAQRLGLTVATEQGRLVSGATVQRILAATSSFFEWAIAAEEYQGADNPMQTRVDPALGRVPDRHQPFVGAASRQQPVRRTVRVRLPIRLPRPMKPDEVDALLGSTTTIRDLALLLLMLDGGLRPGRGAVPATGRCVLWPPPGDDPQTGRPSPRSPGEGPFRTGRRPARGTHPGRGQPICAPRAADRVGEPVCVPCRRIRRPALRAVELSGVGPWVRAKA